MRTTVLHVRNVLDLLGEVVSDAGVEHHAKGASGDGCKYIDSPSLTGRLVSVCIVGRLFDYLGILRALLLTDDYGTAQHSACVIGSTLWNNAAAMGVEFSPDARRFLKHIQGYQDTGTAWGAAVEKGFADFQTDVKERALLDAGAHGGALDNFRYAVGTL